MYLAVGFWSPVFKDATSLPLGAKHSPAALDKRAAKSPNRKGHEALVVGSKQIVDDLKAQVRLGFGARKYPLKTVQELCRGVVADVFIFSDCKAGKDVHATYKLLTV